MVCVGKKRSDVATPLGKEDKVTNDTRSVIKRKNEAVASYNVRNKRRGIAMCCAQIKHNAAISDECVGAAFQNGCSKLASSWIPFTVFSSILLYCSLGEECFSWREIFSVQAVSVLVDFEDFGRLHLESQPILLFINIVVVIIIKKRDEVIFFFIKEYENKCVLDMNALEAL